MSPKKNILSLNSYKSYSYDDAYTAFINSYDESFLKEDQFKELITAYRWMIKGICYTPYSAIVTLFNGAQIEVYLREDKNSHD